MTNILNQKLAKVNDNISVYRYDNGWMFELGGRDEDGDWKTVKTLCLSEDDVIALFREWNSMDMDN